MTQLANEKHTQNSLQSGRNNIDLSPEEREKMRTDALRELEKMREQLDKGEQGLSSDYSEAQFFIPSIKIVFGVFLRLSIATSRYHSVPAKFAAAVRQYAAHNPTDGKILLAALRRTPTFRKGGVMLKLQKGADAITMDNTVFFRGKLSVDTYVHELVHVFQYAILGIESFLISYFGLSIATIIYRLVFRKSLNVMQSSPHERQAYELEARFAKWRKSVGISAFSLDAGYEAYDYAPPRPDRVAQMSESMSLALGGNVWSNESVGLSESDWERKNSAGGAVIIVDPSNQFLIPRPPPNWYLAILWNYKVSSATLKKEHSRMLDALVSLYKQGSTSELRFAIKGHASSTGSEKHNMTLSNQRAINARDYLVGKGVPTEYIKYAGHGSKQPRVPNGSDQNKAINRRVEVLLKRVIVV